MTDIKLSYVITTRNKLPYLKEVMRRLLENIQADEEIIVADGASTDGTVEYLEHLYKQGKIHRFISEPDTGEAHGYNKCFLMARGELIKIITDDDAFYYPGIQESKQFMLANRQVDVLSGKSAQISLEEQNKVRLLTECDDNYQTWLNDGEPVWFIGLPLMIRRSSLSLTGLFFTGFVQVDTEYSLRITSLKHINIAWNTALLAIRIDNPSSNSRNFPSDSRAFHERDRMWYAYSQKYREDLTNRMEKESILLRLRKKYLHPIKRNLGTYLRRGKETADEPQLGYGVKISLEISFDSGSDIENAFSLCDYFFQDFNSKEASKILHKNLVS
jgi:glycosyltransferase involved in cell wall biosynthesis